MMRLFSRFDINFYIKSLVIFMICFTTISLLIKKINIKSLIFRTINYFIQNLVRRIQINGASKVFCLLISTLFLYLFLSNYMSILSFNFTINSQIRIIIFSSLCAWLRFIIFIIYKNMSYFIIHCIPEGTPLPLIFFLFLIELIRQIIRPLTLTVRLVANILAGHLLIILLSRLSLYSFFSFMPYLILNIVEIFVAFIQSYIIITIICLYYNEVV
jgi:ATP synthase subunit 6